MAQSAPLVIAVGNPHRGDDDVGLRVADALRPVVGDGVEIQKQTGESLTLVEAWTGRDLVLVVDAVRAHCPPGTVHRVEIDRDELPRGAPAASTHAFGLAETVELARVLGRLPARMVFWGVTGTRFGMGEEAAEAVVAAVPEVVQGILEDLRTTGPTEQEDTHA